MRSPSPRSRPSRVDSSKNGTRLIYEHHTSTLLAGLLSSHLPRALPTFNALRCEELLPAFASFPPGASPLPDQLWVVLVYLNLGQDQIRGYCSWETKEFITAEELGFAGSFFSMVIKEFLRSRPGGESSALLSLDALLSLEGTDPDSTVF